MEQMSLLPAPKPDVVLDPVNLREEIEQRALLIWFKVQHLPLNDLQRHMVTMYALGMGKAFERPEGGRWTHLLIGRTLRGFIPRCKSVPPEVSDRIQPFHAAGRADAMASFQDRAAWRRMPILEDWICSLEQRSH